MTEHDNPTATETTDDLASGGEPGLVRRRRIGSETASAPEPAPPAVADDAPEPPPPPPSTSTVTRSRTRSMGRPATAPTADESTPATTPKPDRSGAGGSTGRPSRRRVVGGSAPSAPASDAPAATVTRPASDEEAVATVPDLPPPPPNLPPPGPRRPQIGDSRPQIGDSRPAGAPEPTLDAEGRGGGGRKRRRRGGRGKGGGAQEASRTPTVSEPVEAIIDDRPVELDAAALDKRRGKERDGRPLGRYLMCVHVHHGVTHIAVLEGRTLIEHYVSRPSDDVSEIHGNIYLGKVQNVLPGMEAAFVDIGTPKNAVLYRGDVTYDADDLDGDRSQPPPPRAKRGRGRPVRRRNEPRIEDLLKARQTILCQVTKNPISHKGARLSTEVSLPGRFVVLVPNSPTYGISKRLPDKERKRLRNILDKVKPAEHGVIVRTAAEDVTAEEIERDVRRLLSQWEQINQRSAESKAPNLLFREPELAVRIIREEFNKDYRGVIIDDPTLYEQVKGYMESIAPALADRIQFHDPSVESLPLFERYHVAEQLRKAVDRKVWLPSGGSLIIEHTEALTVIDVNTGKNVGKSNLEETVFRNNVEAAEEIAKQLRLRDIGGIIVIDFIDMEVKKNRDEVVRVFEAALARDKTRTQVSAISDLGLVEMTRKRIGEGLLESVSEACEHCDGRGVRLREQVIDV